MLNCVLGALNEFAEIIKDVGLTCLICQTCWISGGALTSPRADGFTSSFCLFFHIKDVLHTTKHKDVLLSEQNRLEKDIGEWMKKFEDCRKEGETKQQQLQELRNEIEENKAKLTQQEMVLHIFDFTEKETLCHWGELFPAGGCAEGSPIGLVPLTALCNWEDFTPTL